MKLLNHIIIKIHYKSKCFLTYISKTRLIFEILLFFLFYNIDHLGPGHNWSWFVADLKSDLPLSVQDIVHIGAKLRTRLLKTTTNQVLLFGNFIASCADLEYLCSMVTKDVHLMHEKDLSLADKMNYPAVERLYSLLYIYVGHTLLICCRTMFKVNLRS